MGSHIYGSRMKTTVEMPEDLYRRAKAEAALQGRRLKDLIEEGLNRVLDEPRTKRSRPRLSQLVKGARGAVASGVADLGSNPAHLAGFGRRAKRDR